jgi:hypothetical protein
MPILFGNTASSGLADSVVGSYDSIATTTLSSAQATITFSSIPATYSHLQLRCFMPPNNSGVGDAFQRLQFNGDTGSTYSGHWISGNGSAAGNGNTVSTTSIPFAVVTGIGNSSLYPSASITDILDYSSTVKYKTLQSITGIEQNTNAGGTSQLYLFSGNWRNTAAITSISFNSAYGSFVSGSSFALYGIKGG